MRGVVPVTVIIVAVILAGAALKAASSVAIPLVAAVFLAFVFWPLRVFLARVMPGWIANIAVFIALSAVMAAFVTALSWSVRRVLSIWPDYANQARRLTQQLIDASSALNLPEGVNIGAAVTRVSDLTAGFLASGLSSAYSGAGTLVMMLSFFILIMFEVPAMQRRVERAFDPITGAHVFELTERLVGKYTRYVIVRTLIGVLTGLFVGLYLWFLGVDFYLAFGFQAFLLNYVPIIGSVVAVILPTIFVAIQSLSWTETLVMASGLTLIQQVIGNYVDPRIQGQQFHITPPLVLVAILLWGWLWGIPGALLGVPIMIGVLLVLEAVPQTRWLALLFGDFEREGVSTRQRAKARLRSHRRHRRRRQAEVDKEDGEAATPPVREAAE
jgi:predicted PurR-regulated permease PerM